MKHSLRSSLSARSATPAAITLALAFAVATSACGTTGQNPRARFITATDADAPAACRDTTVPQYPPIPVNYEDVQRTAAFNFPRALRPGNAPVVFVYYHVQADGSTAAVRLWKTSGVAAADEAALVVGSTMRWRPARCGTEPVSIWYGHPFVVRQPS